MKKLIIILIISALLLSSCSAMGIKAKPKTTPTRTPTLIERIQALESQEASLNLQITAQNSVITDLKSRLDKDEQIIAGLKK
jgi:PBP1b-binding outer membrane lipoprotein LpoB